MCLAVFLAVFDPLTSFNHGLRTLSSAQHPVLLLCTYMCVCVISLIRDVITCSKLTSESQSRFISFTTDETRTQSFSFGITISTVTLISLEIILLHRRRNKVAWLSAKAADRRGNLAKNHHHLAGG